MKTSKIEKCIKRYYLYDVSKGPKIHREIESNVSCYDPLVVSVGPFHRVSIDELYRKVKNVMPNVGECYADESIKDLSDVEFTQMMFLDGCFILQYIYCIVTGNIKQQQMKSHDRAFTRMEMIKQLISVSHGKLPLSNGFFRCIKDFFLDFFGGNLFSPETKHEQDPDQEVPESYTKHKSSRNQLPSHLLELLQTQLVTRIHFRPGKSYRLSDIKWSFSTWSHMKPDTPAGFGDTSYLCVMDSLIDHAEDMKELRSKGILLNFLGSDQEVAALFNEIERDLMPNPYAFVDVENKIENHYNNKVKIWIAEGMYDQLCYPLVYFVIYCSNFAIGLQVIDTVLSGIQTYYAVQKGQLVRTGPKSSQYLLLFPANSSVQALVNRITRYM
ncbi:hypothetical protein P3S68_027169 [Capsicum galapagoense]